MKLTRGRFLVGLAALLAGVWPKRRPAVCLDDPEAKEAWRKAAETACAPQASMRNALLHQGGPSPLWSLGSTPAKFDSENYGTVVFKRYGA